MEEKILQDKLDEIVTEIVRLEDEITIVTNEMKNFENSKIKISEEIESEINKNKEKIREINRIIKNEEMNEGTETKIKEDEKTRISNYIKEIENEIKSLKKKDLEKIMEKEILDKKYEEINNRNFLRSESFEKKRKQQEKENIENARKNYEIKKGIFNLEIEKLNSEISLLNENFEKMNIIKNNYETDLVNLISQKETLEEIIKSYNNNKIIADNYPNEDNNNLRNSSNSINNNNINLYNNNSINMDNEDYFKNSNQKFYNLNNSNNFNNISNSNLFRSQNSINNFYSLKNFELNIEDFKSINKNTIGKALYDHLFEIDTRINILSSKLFSDVIKDAFENYTDNNGIFTSDDIIVLITKKIFDIMLDNKAFSEINPFTADKLRYLLKYFMKIQYYDNLINDKFDFVNIKFELEKKNYEKNIIDLNFKLNNLQNQLEKLNLKQKTFHLDSPTKEKNSYNEYLNRESPYLKAISKLDTKLLELIEQKNDIELKIIGFKQNTSEKIDSLKNEILKLENIINDLKSKKSLFPYEIDQNKIKNNERIISIRSEIAEKFLRIKIIFNSTDHVNNENNLLESCIDKIRQSVNDLRISASEFNNINNDINKSFNNRFKNSKPLDQSNYNSNYNTINQSQIYNSKNGNKEISKMNNFNSCSNNFNERNKMTNYSEVKNEKEKRDVNLRYEKNDFGCMPFTATVNNTNRNPEKTQTFFNLYDNNNKSIDNHLRQSNETFKNNNINDKNTFHNKSSILNENEFGHNNYNNTNINLSSKIDFPNINNNNYNSTNFNQYLERKNNNFKNANQSFNTCREIQYKDFDSNNLGGPSYVESNSRHLNNKSFHHNAHTYSTPYRSIRNNFCENDYKQGYYDDVKYNNIDYTPYQNYQMKTKMMDRRMKKNSCHSLGSLRLQSFPYSNREVFNSQSDLEHNNDHNNFCIKCSRKSITLDPYLDDNEVYFDKIDFNTCRNCNNNYAENLSAPKHFYTNTNDNNLKNDNIRVNKSINQINNHSRNKSSDFSYLKEKYETNKKSYEETKRKIDKDINLRHISPRKVLTNREKNLSNLSKKSYSIKNEKNLKLKSITEKEVLNNSIRNIKNEISNRVDIEMFNTKLIKNNNEIKNKSNKNNYISIQDCGMSKLNDRSKINFNITQDNDYIDNQTASRISSVLGITKEISEKKHNDKLLVEYITQNLLRGPHSKKVK